MNKLLVTICLLMSLSCSKDNDSESGNNNNNNDNPSGSCGSWNGYELYKDADGCYYNSGYGGKTYVDTNLCDC